MALFQFLEWCHDKCEWRTDVVSGINQEFHFLIVHLPALFTDIDKYDENAVIKMINVFMLNTKQEGASGGDQF